VVGGILVLAAPRRALAQQARLPRAKAPRTLLGFESPDAAGSWTGARCRVTAIHVSEGRSALSIHYPMRQGTSDAPVAATIAWANGHGYAVKDWSHYGKAAFDAWVDGPEPLTITVELRGAPGRKAFAKELDVQPGRKNSFELTLNDAADAIALNDVRSIAFSGNRLTRDATMTLDNFRLLPGNRPPLGEFDLLYPNYRQTIFPGHRNISVGVRLSLEEHAVRPADLLLTLTAAGGKSTAFGRAGFTGAGAVATAPSGNLPAGPVAVAARVTDRRSGKVLISRRWTVRKATKAETDATKVYVDDRNNLIVDGKPFFPLGWFGGASMDQLEEIADSPFNTILAYGVNTQSKAYMTSFMDRVQRRGMKIIYCMNDVYPTATYLDKTGWEGIRGNGKIADGIVKAFRSHPAVLAWYLNDELPTKLIPTLKGYYDQVRRNDPSRPCLMVSYQMPDLMYYAPTTDIVGIDRYPIPTVPVTEVRREMRDSIANLKGSKPVWAVIQAFGWYQYNEKHTDRGRIPTAEDLRTGRAPTYDEERCMAYLALVHGAKGLLYYCYYDMRVLPQYPEMWAGLKKIAAEVKALSPVLLAAKDLGPVACSPAGAPLDTMLLDRGGRRYLIAVNTQMTPCRVTFNLGRPPASNARVMFEGRIAPELKGSKLADTFKPLEAHVYELDPAPPVGSR
jgi:hypothetical protein